VGSGPIAPGQFNKITIWALTNTQSLTTSNPNPHLSLSNIHSEKWGTPVPQQQRPGPRPLGDSVKEPLRPVVPGFGDSRMNQVEFADGLLWAGLDTVVAHPAGDGIAYFIVHPSIRNGQVHGTIHNQGYVSAAHTFLSLPSVGVNGDGRGVIAMSLMGPHNYPSAAQINIDGNGVEGPVQIERVGFRPDDGFGCYEAFGGPPDCVWSLYSASAGTPNGPVYSATEFIGDNARTSSANWSTFIWPARHSG
jgi:hypothetical protein